MAVIALFAAGVLLSAALGHGTTDGLAPSTDASPLAAPVLTVESSRGRLLLRGTTASHRHESGLLQLAAEHFGAAATNAEFDPGVVLAQSWESASSRMLYALAAADSAHAIMRERSIEIRGVTSDAHTFESRVEFLRDELPGDTAVVTEVTTIRSPKSHDALCRHAFSELLVEPVSFSRSSAEIRTSSYVTLDRIIDFAYDCPQLRISITGHTDASGDESWNRQLSLARAEAVASHIIRGGIDPGRLLVNGLGSAQPVAANDTAHGRSRNRRIEFALEADSARVAGALQGE